MTPATKHSSTVPGAITGIFISPCPGYKAVSKSDCSVFVGNPVEGPPLCTSITTRGISAIQARPIPSPIKVNPGPAVLVIAFFPAYPAPRILVIDSISDED